MVRTTSSKVVRVMIKYMETEEMILFTGRVGQIPIS
jgi:hypothetical protein